ncbi:MAG: hypothetical protein PVF58_04145 [Candidatus Methanofastidiosia archaeon]|jgi:hypothetical protein
MYKFYKYCGDDKPLEVLEQDEYLTFFADIKKGKSQNFAMYTFPNEVEPKIGDRISPYYYLIPKFKAPLFQNDISLDEFKNTFKTENNENPLPPRGRAIDPDIIHIEIARYADMYTKSYCNIYKFSIQFSKNIVAALAYRKISI